MPWVKRVYTRVCVYPTRVYVLKHLKKYKTPYFRAEIAGFTCWSPVSARGPTVPNQLPTKKLLWEKYKKASMGRPKGGEKREKGYYAEIFPLTRSEVPCAFCTSPILYRKPLFPCVLMFIHHLWHHGESHGRSLLEAWGWNGSGRKLCLEPAEGDSGENIPFLCTLFVYNKRNTCLGSRNESSLC